MSTNQNNVRENSSWWRQIKEMSGVLPVYVLPEVWAYLLLNYHKIYQIWSSVAVLNYPAHPYFMLIFVFDQYITKSFRRWQRVKHKACPHFFHEKNWTKNDGKVSYFSLHVFATFLHNVVMQSLFCKFWRHVAQVKCKVGQNLTVVLCEFFLR